MSSRARRRKVKYQEKKTKRRPEAAARPSPPAVSQAAEAGAEAPSPPVAPSVVEAAPQVAAQSRVLVAELKQVGILGGAMLAVLVLLAIILG